MKVENVPFWDKVVFCTPFVFPAQMIYRSGVLTGRVMQIVHDMKRDHGANVDVYVKRYLDVKVGINTVWTHGLLCTAVKTALYVALSYVFPIFHLFGISIRAWGVIDLTLHGTCVAFSLLCRLRLPAIRTPLK